MAVIIEYGFVLLSMLCLPVALFFFVWWAISMRKKLFWFGMLALGI